MECRAVGFATAVYEAVLDTNYRMQAQKDANRGLRSQIAQKCLQFPSSPGLQMLPFDTGHDLYFPVITATSSSRLGFSTSRRCLMGVSAQGVGITKVACPFDDLLIGYSDYNWQIIESVLHRALQGDPMSFEEWTAQKGQAGTRITNYGNDNTIGGRDATRW